MTPEERAAKEIEEELGFSVSPHHEPGLGPTVYRIDLNLKNGMPATIAGTIEEWKLWSLALRQRVKLNESK